MSDQTTLQESGSKKVYQWQDLQDLVSPAILNAPRLDWRAVDRRHVHSLICTVHAESAVWFEHLTLLTAVLASYIGLDAATVKQPITNLHGRWRQLFLAYGFTAVADWQPEEHLPRYFHDQPFPDSLNTRQDFLQAYTADAEYSQAYLKALPRAEREIYLQWTLPAFSRREARKISRRPEIVEAQKQQRKLETDALTPHLPKIRGEAHLRWNELKRLRTTFGEALALIESGQKTVPLAFSYEEPGSGQRFHFMVWDRPHFVLAHREYYQHSAISRAKKQIQQRDSKPFFYLLEFVKAEHLAHSETSATSDGPLWFGDLLRYGLLRDGPFRGDTEELQRQRSYLESWG